MIALLPFCTPWLAAAVPTVRREQASLAEVSVHFAGQTSRSQPKAKGGDEIASFDYCNWDFPLGDPATNDCLDSNHAKVGHHLMNATVHANEGMPDCLEAMHQAGVNKTTDFKIENTDDYGKFPSGCFTQPCTAAGDRGHEEVAGVVVNPLGQCYFYNPTPTIPAVADLALQTIPGTPVCKRDRIVYGTANTNGDPAEGHCPDGYQQITTREKCEEFAGCMSHCPGEELGGFSINTMDASVYDQFPKYCFLSTHQAHNCVYFNEPRPGMVDPVRPIGIPLCNVSTITHFPAKQSL